MSDFRLPPTPIITGKPQGQPVPRPVTTNTPPVTGEKSFREMLGQAVQSQTRLTLSKHAMHRAEQRGIPLSDADMDRMNSAIDKARDKGVTDTLVFMNNAAFIVNVPSKVVVTVVDGNEAQENIFTNINGAVIL
jgi:flagellar operon protein